MDDLALRVAEGWGIGLEVRTFADRERVGADAVRQLAVGADAGGDEDADGWGDELVGDEVVEDVHRVGLEAVREDDQVAVRGGIELVVASRDVEPPAVQRPGVYGGFGGHPAGAGVEGLHRAFGPVLPLCRPNGDLCEQRVGGWRSGGRGAPMAMAGKG